MLVEDDEVIRESLAEMLGDLGYHVSQATDGEMARQMLAAGHRFSLLVTDLWMPRLNGVELLAWCQGEQLHMPTVVMSSDRGLSAQIERFSGGVRALLLRKPFGLPAFVECVTAARRAVAQPEPSKGPQPLQRA